MENTRRGSVVSLCDRTGVMVMPWAEAGYDCLCIDTAHPQRSDRVRNGVTYRWGDVRSLTLADLPDDVVAMFAFPPCTHLTVAGARDWKRKGLRLLIEALEVVEACRVLCENSGAPWLIENPVGRLSSAWRKPDYTFNPNEYGAYLDPPGDAYTKRTCIWQGGGAVEPPRLAVEVTEGSKMHLMSGNRRDSADLRSVTPAGFALAVFHAWGDAAIRAKEGV